MSDTRFKVLVAVAVILAIVSIFLLLKNRSLNQKTRELEAQNQTLQTQNKEARRRAKTLEDLLVAFDVNFSKTLRPETEPKLDELVKSFRDPAIEKEWEELRSAQGAKLTPEFLVTRVRSFLIAIVSGIETSLGKQAP